MHVCLCTLLTPGQVTICESRRDPWSVGLSGPIGSCASPRHSSVALVACRALSKIAEWSELPLYCYSFQPLLTLVARPPTRMHACTCARAQMYACARTHRHTVTHRHKRTHAYKQRTHMDLRSKLGRCHPGSERRCAKPPHSVV